MRRDPVMRSCSYTYVLGLFSDLTILLTWLCLCFLVIYLFKLKIISIVVVASHMYSVVITHFFCYKWLIHVYLTREGCSILHVDLLAIRLLSKLLWKPWLPHFHTCKEYFLFIQTLLMEGTFGWDLSSGILKFDLDFWMTLTVNGL